MLWVVGVSRLSARALCYAELGAALPRSGGEYNFLSRIYHPLAGFISGWVSATAGFAAPTALAALTFGSYFSSVFPSLSALWLASGLVVLLTAIHCTSHASSGGVQSALTALKLMLIVGFSALALTMVETPQPIVFSPVAGDGALLLGGSFAVSLIFVNYAYSGWNAATYISSELAQPRRHLPIILISSTALVALCYLLLNYVFLFTAPVDALVGKVEVGYVAAQYAFGATGATIMGILLALLLVSTVSAMIVAGPRVLHAIGQDFPAFKELGVRIQTAFRPRHITAVCCQPFFPVDVLLRKHSYFFRATMALNTFFAVLGVFVLRWTRPELERPYKTWLYPLPPLIFLAITGWTLVYTVLQRPVEAWMCAGIILSGAIFYGASVRLGRRRQ